MYESSLTDAVLRYQKTGEGKKTLVDDIALRVYRMAHLKPDWDEDAAGDFFCSFFPKIPGLMDRYVYSGSAFEAYLYVHVIWSIKGFARKLKTRSYEETLITYKSFWEVHEQSPEEEFFSREEISDKLRSSFHIDEEGTFLDAKWKQRFIFLILRESEYLDNSLVESIVAATGVNRKWLMNCVVSLRNRIEKRRRRLENLRTRRNYWFSQYYMLQLRIADTFEDKKKEELLQRLAFTRRRFLRARERVVEMHAHPTNRDIAEVLNIPKGSIDSGIHQVLKKYRTDTDGRPAREKTAA
jgi:hypothetical protein